MLSVILRVIRRLLRSLDLRIAKICSPESGAYPHRGSSDIDRFKNLLLRVEMPDAAGQSYLSMHLDRMARTLSLAPPPGATSRALELGCYMQMTPLLGIELGYTEVCGAYYGSPGTTERKTARYDGQTFQCEIQLFDAERDAFPYPDGSFDLVLACEIVEHLEADPMHMLLEINRVLAREGTLILTTPNCVSLLSVSRALQGRQNPQVFAAYPNPERGEARGAHVREYAPAEVHEMIRAAGFRVIDLFTETSSAAENTWVQDLLKECSLGTENRGEQIYCVAKKQPDCTVTRFPAFLYTAR